MGEGQSRRSAVNNRGADTSAVANGLGLEIDDGLEEFLRNPGSLSDWLDRRISSAIKRYPSENLNGGLVPGHVGDSWRNAIFRRGPIGPDTSFAHCNFS